MADITLSAAVRNNLLSLQNTAKLMGKTQERLATGLKVNSALDDPNAFFTASALNSRASDLNRLLDTVGLSVQTIKAADDGINAITKLIEAAQATVRQARLSNPSIASSTGSAVLDPVETLDNLGFADGDTVEITANGETTTYTVGTAASTSVDDLVQGLNANTQANVSLSAGGLLQIELIGSGDLVIGEGSQGTNLADLGLTAQTISPDASSNRQDYADQYDLVLEQITRIAGDASFNGINLLDGDNLTVTFNEDGSSAITVNGVDFTSVGLGLQSSTDGFQGNAEIDTVLGTLDSALRTLRTQASTFGSNLSIVEVRQDFTKNLVNTLESGAANLTLADTNEEGANMLALQTRQQLSSVALSLASDADQNVLRLFQ